MKTKAIEFKPTRPLVMKAVCRSIAMILAALVLQGCATAKTAWSRHDDPLGQPTTILERNTTSREPNPLTVLVSWTF